jgi:hypothetical protein
MKPPTYEINRPIYLLGDHHGYTGEIFEAIAKQSVRNAVILHVGDGEEGISFGPRQFEELNAEFAKRNLLFLGMRGNHCDPHLFDGRIDLPHYKLVPDYTRLSANGESWLLIGGAISIDRLDRVPGIEWWPEENFQLRRDLIEPADVLVTHSGPSWCGPSTKNGFVRLFEVSERRHGSDLIAELDAERALHDEAFSLVRPRHWYLGHFHCSETFVRDGCATRILDICGIRRHLP